MSQLGHPAWGARERTFGWYRVYEGFVGHKKVRAVARATGIEYCRVHTTMNAMFEEASKAKPRGSLADFDVYDCAANIEIPAEDVARVYAELEFRQWIIHDQIGTWNKRNPDREDPGAADRKQASRDNIKATRRMLAEPPTAVTLPSPDDRSEEAALTRMYWLNTFGRDLVADRLVIAPVVASTLIHGWLRDARRDYIAVATIISGALDLGLEGQRFRDQVAQRIREFAREKHGQRPLPLGLTSVKGGAA